MTALSVSKGLKAALLRVQVDDPADGSPAHRAEAHPVPREHDAVGLRPVEAARLVGGAFERADRRGERHCLQQLFVGRPLAREVRVHFVLRGVPLTNLLPPRLERGLRVTGGDDGAVRVRIGVPSVVGRGRLGTISARARFEPQR